jgi:hypothetical protein
LIKDNRKGDLDLKIIPEKEFIKLEADADKGSPRKWNSGDFLKWTRCLMTYPTKNSQGKILEWNLDSVRLENAVNKGWVPRYEKIQNVEFPNL